MEVIILASGSSGNCALVRSGGATILIDAGVTRLQICRRLAVFGLKADAIDAIVVTHEHGDHVRGLEVLVRQFEIPVWMTAGSWSKVTVRCSGGGELVSGKNLTVGAITVAVMLIFGWALLRYQKKQLLDAKIQCAHQLSETIKKSTREDMKDNRLDDVYRIIHTIGEQKGIDRVRIFEKNGEVIYSTREDEIGSRVDMQAEACYACQRVCPSGVAVADIMRYWMYATAYGRLGEARRLYRALPARRRAEACEGCGQCEAACSQGLPVRQRLELAHQLLA